MRNSTRFLPLFLFFIITAMWHSTTKAQSCDDLSFTYTTTESRCVSTGSITINVTGGSGNYNYKATGPVNTPYTSSATITGLQPGTYSIIVKDIGTNCEITTTGAVVSGTYSDPRFQLNRTNVTCAGNDGTITVTNQQYGRSPFMYSIIAPSASNVGSTSATGQFTDLLPGDYLIQLTDSCGGIQVRRTTIEPYTWLFDSYSVTRIGCDSADAAIVLRDNKGNLNTSGGAFNGFSYGVVQAAGDTLWYANPTFRFHLGSKRSVTLVAQDNCGNRQSAHWSLPAAYAPSAGSVTSSNLACSTFTATVNGQTNLSNPQYCLYTSSNALIACNTTGVFNNVAYGSYCINILDACYDTTIQRCFTVNRPVPAVGASVSLTSKNCTKFTATITGQVNLTDPEYCLYNSSNTLISCNSTGVFNHLSYGNYCITMKDGCTDTLITRCFTASKTAGSLTGINIYNSTCASFSVSTTGSNLVSPKYCLFNSDGAEVSCNTTGVFTNVPHGSYCIKAITCNDTTNAFCFSSTRPIASVSSTVSIGNAICNSFTASITGQTNLTNPQYCLYDSTNTLIACNTTGVFDSVSYGAHCIRITDSCLDTVITRCFSPDRPLPHLSNAAISNATCTTFSVTTSGNNLTGAQYCLYDNSGSVVACNNTGIFSGLAHGSYCIKAITCDDTSNAVCFTSVPPELQVDASVQTSDKLCNTFTATLSAQSNASNLQYCLYDYLENVVSCNTTGIFTSIPYGSYCIVVTGGCYDTTIVRCFSETRPLPRVNGTLRQTNNSCTTFTVTVMEQTNLTNPQFCLLDTLNNILDCNTTGVFDNVPYGRYCVTIKDGCVDTTIRLCQTFSPDNKFMSVTSSKSCTAGKTNIDVSFTNAFQIYSVFIYHPNGTLVYSNAAASNPQAIQLPALPGTLKYKVIGGDGCGWKDTTTITPDAASLTRSIVAESKCPSATSPNGSGDLVVNCSSNAFAVYPAIIKKNNAAYNRSYSSQSGTTFQFNDLEPADYIVEYTIGACGSKVYDTFALQPYVYPTQNRSAVYQCDNNSISLGADVTGGAKPYAYQIIGSMPETPAVATPLQSGPLFNINNGTIYSLLRLRTIDACGNATLNDVSVLPLQNLTINATGTCFYQNITLSVDSLPNTEYKWYRKRTATDSSLVGEGASFNLPFFVPEESGVYVCETTVNNECLTRLSYFTLDGQCSGYEVLPTITQLSGKVVSAGNQLEWLTADERDVVSYTVERRKEGGGFISVGTVPVKISKSSMLKWYLFTDNHPNTGVNDYRLKISLSNRKTTYSNTIRLSREANLQTSVYPNPVGEMLNVSIKGSKPANYRIELFNQNGQILLSKELQQTTSTIWQYQRNNAFRAGMYLVKIINTTTGITETYKVLFK